MKVRFFRQRAKYAVQWMMCSLFFIINHSKVASLESGKKIKTLKLLIM